MIVALKNRDIGPMLSLFRRKPDLNIGGEESPYLRRWYLIPRNRFFNVYLHQFLRSDDDRALHDHPWNWCSIIIKGAYEEVMPGGNGYRLKIVERKAPSIRFGRAKSLHRIIILHGDKAERAVWTIFITGPRIREWGFQCQKGWVPWRTFLGAPNDAKTSGNTRGPGCGE